MAAWIGQHWQAERRGLMDDEETSRRRMVDFMLGPFIASKPAHQHLAISEQHTTLELLPAAIRSCSPVSDNMGCTHIELEPETPLPSGWEKCLNLKTGNIYYLNRTSGATSVSDPRKDASQYKPCSRGELSLSPSTSELTVEASNEVVSNSNGKLERSFNINEKPKSVSCNEQIDLDLNLSLYVGLCSSPKRSSPPSRDVAVLTLLPLSSTSPSKLKASTNINACSASSSSSSASSPISASLAFSQTILSSKELSQNPPHDRASFYKQESNQATRFAMKGSTFCGDRHQSVSEYVQSMGETSRKLVESEDLSSAATMVTVACANCLMFVMLSRSNPKCPRCGISCSEQMEFPQPPFKRAKLGFSF